VAGSVAGAPGVCSLGATGPVVCATRPHLSLRPSYLGQRRVGRLCSRIPVMPRLPETIQGEDMILRLWRVADAELQHRTVLESAEHLSPWMAWLDDGPQTLEERREMLARWEAMWEEGGDANYAVLVEQSVVGSAGLHRRVGPGALEIGYWVHASFVRRGIATRAAALLTGSAFALPEIERVEIHHDKANTASAGVPRRLGYRFIGEQPDERTAPADTGVECVWRITRADWLARAHER
jgi:ribosomal-protein-serine acetyltransferase